MTKEELVELIFDANDALVSGMLPVAKAAHLASVCDAISADIEAGRDDGDAWRDEAAMQLRAALS